MSVYDLNDDTKVNNLLVGQKDRILRLINDCQLVAATAALSVVRDLWETCDYGYKFKELESRIKDRLDEIQAELEEARNSTFNR